MYKCILFLFLCSYFGMYAQNGMVGIGTENPVQTLDINGKMRIGNDIHAPVEGSVRYNEVIKDFEGYNGSEWKSLTASYSDSPTINSAGVMEEQGFSVAIHKDFAVIGSPKWDNNTGILYVFKNINKQWVYQNAYFWTSLKRNGACVAINDDFIFAGAPETYNTNRRGGIHILKKVNGSFEYFSAVFGAYDFELLGTSMSLHGNLLAVGSKGRHAYHPSYPNSKGSVYVYSIDPAGLTQIQRIENPIPFSGYAPEFGASVALDSTTLVVGAPLEEVGANDDQGLVHIFTNDGTNNYINPYPFVNPNGATNDQFGRSLGLSNSNLLVSSPSSDKNSIADVGEVFFCEKDATGQFDNTNMTTVENPIQQENTFFGQSLAILNKIAIIGNTRGAYQYIKFNNQWQYHKMISKSLRGIEVFNTTSISIYGNTFGLGDATFNNNFGRIALGDCRY
ncbi:MAG: hypothetical protein IPI53_17790 [Saprospiraceae bacterium]|nr:hypothetical protein [Saprospiraceae bacterium]